MLAELDAVARRPLVAGDGIQSGQIILDYLIHSELFAPSDWAATA